MNDPILIRQEQPIVTREGFSKRTWNLYVMNQYTREYEHHSMTWSFPDAIALADRMRRRANSVAPLEPMEPTC